MNNGTLLSGTIAGILPDNYRKSDTMPPVAILRQLAYELGRKTRNIVEGRVRTRGSDDDGTFGVSHVFHLVAPALDGLQYELFRVEQDDIFSLYPVTIVWNISDPTLTLPVKVNNEAQLVEALQGVFRSGLTTLAIQSLITQSTAVVPSGLGDEDEG